MEKSKANILVVICLIASFILLAGAVLVSGLLNDKPKAITAQEIYDLIDTEYSYSQFTITNDATYPWSVYEAGYGELVPGNSGYHSTTSTLTITFPARVGDIVSFDWAVSSESGCDYITVTIFGSTVVSSVSGTTHGTSISTLRNNYQNCSYYVTTTGSCELKITYRKDGSVNTGLDKCFVKNIRIFRDNLAEDLPNIVSSSYDFSEFNFSQNGYPWKLYQTGYNEIAPGNTGLNSTTSSFTIKYNARVRDVLSFKYAISSESSYDYIQVTVNGSSILNTSGTTHGTDIGTLRNNFQNVSYTITGSGTYTIVFNYVKNSSTHTGLDLCLVKDIRITSEMEAFYSIMDTTYDVQKFSLTNNSSYPWYVYDASLKELAPGNKGIQGATSTFSISYTAGVGDEISFDYVVSSESCCDYIYVTVNGNYIVNNTGGTNYGTTIADMRNNYLHYSTTITTAGTWTISFTYRKDGSVDTGADIALVRNLSIREPYREVSVTSNNTNYGTVSGGGTLQTGSTHTITATPKAGYKFKGWSLDGSDSLIATNPYSFEVRNNASYVAIFEKYFTVNFTAVNGTVQGVSSGDYYINTSLTAYAFGGVNMEFAYWINSNTGAKVTSNPLVISVTESTTYTAVFIDRNITGVNITSDLGGAVSLIGADFNSLGDNDLVYVRVLTVVSGKTFSHWEDKDGNNLGTDTILAIAKKNVINNVITAKFV